MCDKWVPVATIHAHMRSIKTHLKTMEPQLADAEREEKEVRFVYQEMRRFVGYILNAALDLFPEDELSAVTFMLHQALEDYQQQLMVPAPDPATARERYEEFRRRTHSMFVAELEHHTWQVDADHGEDADAARLGQKGARWRDEGWHLT